MNDMARVVWSGDEQAVVLPEGYRFATAEVRITREGNRIVLEADDAVVIDEETGLPLAELRRLIQEGLDSGPDAPLDMAAIKQRGRERLAGGVMAGTGR